jgi:hypothetical protein
MSGSLLYSQPNPPLCSQINTGRSLQLLRVTHIMPPQLTDSSAKGGGGVANSNRHAGKYEPMCLINVDMNGTHVEPLGYCPKLRASLAST